ncbi:hypothetical protein OOU_Y34scaffold00857g5 [Pyricularia oryzae Y34]|uniref:Uncharacterized protein n=1 Tax=Pyricularia oryzae (strain Y34) TaxID=1143189 RepID=A0AA97NP95_PYRO3|nr:hypothetical protein OOU_Y34scaffold00857g5 [Pyricularia oryzae Y34]
MVEAAKNLAFDHLITSVTFSMTWSVFTLFAGFEVEFERPLAVFVEIVNIVMILIDRKPIKVFKEPPEFLVRCRFALLEAVLDDGRPFLCY